MRRAFEAVAHSFHASWFSRFGAVAAMCALFVALFLWMLSDPQAPRVVAWSGLLLFGAGLGLMVHQVLGRGPVLHVGPGGLAGRGLRGHTVPWHEVEDVELQSIQGNDQLLIRLVAGAPSLDATRRLFNRRSPLRAVPLGALRGRDREAAVAAALVAFDARGGPPQALLQQQAEALLAELHFDTDLERQTPRPWAFYLMIGLNVAVWLIQVAAGISPVAPGSADLLAWGANNARWVGATGEWWRLLTAAFVHGGLMHLALNLLGLWGAGLMVNRLYGNGQFLLIYLGSALVGNALSLHFAARYAVSVGASGAVFGMLGALVVALVQHRHRLPGERAGQLIASQAVFVLGSLAQGFGRSGIDNAAHVGGLLTGSVLAWLLVEQIDETASGSQRWRGRVLAMAVLALALGLLIASAGNEP